MANDRIKVHSGYNTDLIGKFGRCLGESGDGTMKVVIDGRAGQVYEIPSVTVQRIVEDTPQVTPQVKKSVEKLDVSKVNNELLIKKLDSIIDIINDIKIQVSNENM